MADNEGQVLEDLEDPNEVLEDLEDLLEDTLFEDPVLPIGVNNNQRKKTVKNKLKKVKKSKKMTREEFEELLYSEMTSRFPRKRSLVNQDSRLNDFDDDGKSGAFVDLSKHGYETVCQGLSDFSSRKECPSGNNLFNYQELLDQTSSVSLFTYVSNIKVRELQIGNVVPYIKGYDWENAYFEALFQVKSVDPVINLSLISPRKKNSDVPEEIYISYPIINLLVLNSNGLSRISEKSLNSNEICHIDFVAASNSLKRLSNNVRFGGTEEFAWERLSSNVGGSSSSFQKDAMVVIEKLLDKNKTLINRVFYMHNNIDSIPSKLSLLKKIPKFYLVNNPPGLSMENILKLILIVNGLKKSPKPEKTDSFHLSSLLQYTDYFKNASVVKLGLDMYIEILGSVYEDKFLFVDIFRNVSSVFTNSTRNILNAPVESLLDLISTILVNFSLILRNPVLESCSKKQLIEHCQRELFIDENAFLLETLTERGSFFHGKNVKNKSSGKNQFKNDNYVDQDDYGNNSIGRYVEKNKSKKVNNISKEKKSKEKKKSSTLCWRDLSHTLKISQDECSFHPNCRFNHVVIPGNPDNAWKTKLKQDVNAMAQISDKQKFIVAIDGL